MAKIPGTNVIAPVVPFDTSDVHPSHEARYGKGGYRTVATMTERNAIPAARREAGMLVFVAADGTTWRLDADLTTWSPGTTQGPQGEPGAAGDTGPAGEAGPQGEPGEPGVVAATAPLTYVAETQTVALAIGTGLEVVDEELTLAAHSHAASDITSGTLARERLPIANETQLGGVIAGAGITIFSAGVIVPTYGSTAQTSCQGNDARLSNSREWSASTITQEDAEAGTSTTRRAFTAQRVFQAIAAWWAASSAKTKLDGISGTNTGDQTITLTGDVTGSGTGTFTATLANSGATAGTYTSVTVDAKGRVTAGSSPAVAYSSLSGIPATFAPSSHTHPLSELSQSGATLNQVPQWSGSAWVPATVSGGGGSPTTSASDLTSGTLDDARLSAKALAGINLYLWGNFR